MKREPKNRIIKIIKENREWKLQQQFSAFVDKLNRLPDANGVQRNPVRSAPAALTEMVF
ncbi:hypothetical protein KXD93_06920 [Mucilaginibacter sp. BJC16-A38]|uniref:hypothetical protein n=1 Tax=Mucilaginibacter phenanthrenivorans TaxID=1234842 RepID=UPI002156FB05|nr:hypothetical protein [Mucilaginibacter phenanthrenivorans]MCR8557366.1 hypothetical protein [Mucilaginibacter phenanthrenivorans]